MSGQDKDRGWNWPIIGLLISVGYGLVLWFAIQLVHGLAIADPGHWLALNLNELGDFLAGAFAPLAFLWLFVAVMVQSQELRLQREELKLTREEFKKNGETLAAQAAEAKAQVALLGEQTSMWRAEREEKFRTEVDSEFFSLLDAIKDYINDRGISIFVNPKANPSSPFKITGNEQVVLKIYMEDKNIRILHGIASTVDTVFWYVKNPESYKIVEGDSGPIRKIIDDLNALQSLAPNTSQAIQHHLGNIRIGEITEKLGIIAGLLKPGDGENPATSPQPG